MRVLVELRFSPDLHAAAAAAEAAPEVTASVSDRVDGLALDGASPPVRLPAVGAPPSAPWAAAASEMADFSLSPDRSTYLARGTVPDAAESQRAALAATAADPNVVGVFSDPTIESTIVCP